MAAIPGAPHRDQTAVSRTHCIHFGAPTGETVECPTCTGNVELKVFSCTIHKTCTPTKTVAGHHSCLNCREKRPPENVYQSNFTKIVKRNLLLYIYPVAGTGVWQRIIDEFTSRIDLFNGRIVLCVSQDGPESPPHALDASRVPLGTDSAELVFERFLRNARGRGSVKTLTVRNTELGETAHHNRIFAENFNLDPDSATLYAHSKGVTRRPGHMAHRWRSVLLETLIDRYGCVEAALETKPVAGSFKKIGHGWGNSRSNWHYSGSWFWFRDSALYARDWTRIEPFYGGIEAYPSLHFKSREAACVFHPCLVRTANFYDSSYWSRYVDSDLDRFRGQWPVRKEIVSF